jgi:hypothetical protein
MGNFSNGDIIKVTLGHSGKLLFNKAEVIVGLN